MFTLKGIEMKRLTNSMLVSRNARTILPSTHAPSRPLVGAALHWLWDYCGTVGRPRGACRRLHLEDVVELEAEVLTSAEVLT